MQLTKADMMKAIGARIRARRERLGLSQERVATLLSMSIGNYSRIEAGRVGLNAGDIMLLANALDVSAAWLFGEIDEPSFPQEERDILAFYRTTPAILKPTARALLESLAKQRENLQNAA